MDKILKINGKVIDDKILTTETSLAIERAFGMLLTTGDLENFSKLEAILNGLPDNTTIEREIVTETKKSGKVRTTKKLTVGTVRQLMKVGHYLLIEVESDKKKAIGITPLANLIK